MEQAFAVVITTLWLLANLPSVEANPALDSSPLPALPSKARFEVRVATNLLQTPGSGRLLLILGFTNAPEPRTVLTQTGLRSPPRLGRDVTNLGAGRMAVLDANCALFPQAHLGEVPAREYFVQAVLMTNRDLWLPDAPGNWVSWPQRVRFDPSKRDVLKLTLDHGLPDEILPADSDLVKFVKLRSEKLSAFWGRPMFLRAGIILPKGWDTEPSRRYPLVVQIGGFGTRFDHVVEMMKVGSQFREQWLADGTPRFVLLQLDGAGPLGDPYQVNSDNHGPYGDALVDELLPHIESAYRCVGQPHARILTGGSTGGWVSLALQVFYPNLFGGCWSGFPDPTDFRALQLVNVYIDTNAFVNAAGFERPCAREINGDTEFTMRHETQLENVVGLGNSYVFSGGQWGSWNATYSPRGADGRPRAIWDPRTGVIDRKVAEAWRRYDLREVLEKQWSVLGPALRGKIHIWMGDADTYFLDSATRHLDEFLRRAEPPADARIEFGPRQPHGWMPRSWSELLKEMQLAVEANAPKPAASN
ncbi:MAG TPA: alpha/beta hydrolase-fold protein [Verrucomicrobiota bacterium]|nr:alpha/beta hydrolase-fold protein [Verrucomicrobiota bacterium]